MPYGIIQCYLPPGSGDFPAFTPTKAGILDLATPEGCKGELTWVVVISQDSLPAKDGHLSQKYQGSVIAGIRTHDQKSQIRCHGLYSTERL